MFSGFPTLSRISLEGPGGSGVVSRVSTIYRTDKQCCTSIYERWTFLILQLIPLVQFLESPCKQV